MFGKATITLGIGPHSVYAGIKWLPTIYTESQQPLNGYLQFTILNNHCHM